jgi:hypothetical protein
MWIFEDAEFHSDWFSAVDSQDPNFFFPELSDHEPVRLRGHVIRGAASGDPYARLEHAIDSRGVCELSERDRAVFWMEFNKLRSRIRSRTR